VAWNICLWQLLKLKLDQWPSKNFAGNRRSAWKSSQCDLKFILFRYEAATKIRWGKREFTSYNKPSAINNWPRKVKHGGFRCTRFVGWHSDWIVPSRVPLLPRISRGHWLTSFTLTAARRSVDRKFWTDLQHSAFTGQPWRWQRNRAETVTQGAFGWATNGTLANGRIQRVVASATIKFSEDGR
jgi:hypothetical protein